MYVWLLIYDVVMDRLELERRLVDKVGAILSTQDPSANLTSVVRFAVLTMIILKELSSTFLFTKYMHTYVHTYIHTYINYLTIE